ncbi:Grx4 family monothiol glutaredoxin [Cladophialophora bantiana CBS 173.52]|uniref:Grx4 family monothiol glutaredoxin n=1 Tax=Cladophialophora bantiana (strain ATCC 10958 / CBS 173.52 / CDC B-1940 / NIH 8579) TaxID=1442370 RepID=A0A0D2ENZ6_CLAB1|nr:Grx4 family monothiol glutaredoxin [Cladophialophora bantiana CBS 173.52]KIW91706.1 Grx4 family monothiol glutaredoxin [Cladophialophora bantiana CBS 173.52]
MATLTLQEIPSEAAFNQHISSTSPSHLHVIYFHTPWAAPCAQTNAILSALASTYPSSRNSDLSFLSINAEELPDISEIYDVTAVPYLVIQRDGKTLETVSGSDASKLRAAVEKHAGTGSDAAHVNGNGTANVPPPLKAEPQSQAQTNGSSQQPTSTKDLSSYAPTPSDPQTAPAYSSGLEAREELNDRLAKLVKAAPVMLFMKGTPSAPQCGFSRQLVSILRENQVKYGQGAKGLRKYRFFNILADNDVREGLKVFSDWPTFPQLYTNGELVGGLDIVREELEADPDFFAPYRATATTA